MKEMKLVYFSVTSNEIPNFSEAVSTFRREVAPLAVHARSRTQLAATEAEQAAFVTRAMDADVVIVTLMAGRQSCPAWETLMDWLSKSREEGRRIPYFHVQPTGNNARSLELVKAHSDGVETDDWRTLSQYFRYGGVANLTQMLISLYNRVFNLAIPTAPPQKLPYEGIYHPDLDTIPTPEAYRRRLDPRKPTLGIWYYQNFWMTNNKAHIDALIREVEKQGANVICVFHMRFRDELLDNHGADYIIDNYFMADGMPVIDALINPVMFNLSMAAPEYKGLLKRLDVPVIQAIAISRSIDEWQASDQGLSNVDITIAVAQPEFDGVIINVPVASKQFTSVDPVTGSAINKYVPIPERTEKMVRLAMNWARLRRIPNARKKIAIVFHHYPPRNDRIGCASGLDTFASIAHLLENMAERGYRLERSYEDGGALSRDLLSRMTTDRRWMLPEQMAKRAEATADSRQYLAWNEALPETVRKKMAADWGKPPGDLFTHDGRLLFPGMINGNVFITIQPPRGYLEQIDKLYHDLHLSPPHHYLAQYGWIRDEFGADAVMHVGKHGSLEWLPGKAVGLSNTCYPDLAIMELPNVYPYIINDPGEGTQAKRRAYACIVDHLPPALANADLYEDLADLDNLLKEYDEARIQDQAKLAVLRPMIWDAVAAADLDQDLGVTREAALSEFDGFMAQLHGYLSTLADTTILDGLHTLGQPPAGEHLLETLAQLTRLSNGSIPSLREAIISALGFDYDALLDSRGTAVPGGNGATGGQIIQKAHDLVLAMLKDLLSARGDEPALETLVARHLDRTDARVVQALSYIRTDLMPRLARTADEITACLNAFDGRYVAPGPSGTPSRGQANILPTGRNFYSVDPQKIPTPAAWRVGKKLGDALIERYLSAHDQYPDSVGIILWASPTMRSKGDDIAEILYLMGVKPVWQAGSGNVKGLEVIPAADLGRPRIDVVPRISGIFRDAFPILTDLIDQGVRMVAALEETPETNFIRRHVIRDVAALERDGMSTDAAFREATFRVFGAPPGSYGAGVAELIESKKWDHTDDLGNMYIQWSSHAYGEKVFGAATETAFRRVLGRMSVTVKNEDSREKDMMSCTDFYNYHGGLISAVRSVQGKLPFSLSGDSADPDRVQMRTTAEEAKHVFRSRLLNPKWLEGLQRHGYKGAGDISKAMDIIIGWDATAAVVDNWMYQRFANKVALNPGMQEWMKSVNPYALQNIIDKLLEANARDLWQTNPETLDALKEAYLDIEGEIEGATEDLDER